MYRDWQQFRRGWRRIFTESADRKPRRLMQHAWRCRWLGRSVPIWTQAAGVYGAAVVAREPLAGSMLLALWLVATVLWLGTLLRVASAAQAPLWTAPLHVVGSWLTARVLVEAARDIRGRQTLKWAGRDYHLGVKKSS